jgi:hypothetical protein
VTLTPRQWLVLGVLILGFGIAAWLVRDDGASSPTFDEGRWCEGASALVGTGPILDGTAEAVTRSDLERVRDAVYDVEFLAPEALHNDLARLSDMNFLLREAIDDEPWPDVYVSVQDNVDVAAVDRAIADLDTEMRACGLRLFP